MLRVDLSFVPAPRAGRSPTHGAWPTPGWRPGCCCATASSCCWRWSSRCCCSSAAPRPAASSTSASGRRIDVLTPGVLALAVMSTSFTSLAIATAFERRYGVLKRLGASPLSRGGLLLGKVLCLLVIEVAQLAGHLRWPGCCWAGSRTAAPRPSPRRCCWSRSVRRPSPALGPADGRHPAGRGDARRGQPGLRRAARRRRRRVPLSSYPDGAARVVSALPSGALAEGLREVCSGAGLVWWRVGVLVAWALAAGALTDAGRSDGSDRPTQPPRRTLKRLAVATLVANIVHRGDRRRGPADRLGARLPDLAAMHRAARFVVHGALGVHGFDRVRQPDADLRAGRRRDRHLGRGAASPAAAAVASGGSRRRAHRRPGAGGCSAAHRADRPQPVGRRLPPAAVAGDHRRRRRAPAADRRGGPPAAAHRPSAGRPADASRCSRRPGRCCTSARSSPGRGRTPATRTAPRTGLHPGAVSQLHADLVFLLVGLTVGTLVAFQAARRRSAPSERSAGCWRSSSPRESSASPSTSPTCRSRWSASTCSAPP